MKQDLEKMLHHACEYREQSKPDQGGPAAAVLCLSLCAFALVFLQGCSGIDLYGESYMSPNRLQIEDQRYQEDYSLGEAKLASADVAERFRRHGSGPLQVDVTYDPKTGSMQKALTHARAVARDLRAHGVQQVEASALPVRGARDSHVVFSYQSYNALPPDDCTMMPGYHGARVEHDPDYQIGCTLESVFAMQVARPKDLAGVSGLGGYGDGRRAANLADIYRSGAPNEPLSGENASE